MERRSFLRGVFGGVAAGGLILKATPREIEAFAAPLKPRQPLVIDPIPSATHLQRGMVLYNARGEPAIEIQDAEIEFRRGALTRVHIRALPMCDAFELIR